MESKEILLHTHLYLDINNLDQSFIDEVKNIEVSNL
jgi:hypothetical protein